MWLLSPRTRRRGPLLGSGGKRFQPRLEVLEDRSVPSAGALDPTFGSGGMVTGPIEEGNVLYSEDVVVQPTDGKIVATGFALARYNPGGSLDSTFGQNGVVSTAVSNAGGVFRAIALQSNGDIVAAGTTGFISKIGNEFALARYTSTGALDTSFGSGGIVLTKVLAPGQKVTADGSFAVAIYPNTGTSSDKIYLAGYSRDGSGTFKDFTLIRYNFNGSLDTTFGNGGIVVTPSFPPTASSGNDIPFAIAIEPADGKIVLAGDVATAAGQAVAVARYLPNGSLDTTFNPGGTLSPGVPGIVTVGNYAQGRGVLIQSSRNNAIVVCGSGSSPGWTLVRLTSTGQLDTSFGGSGTGFAGNSGIGVAWSIAQDPNGDLITTGTTTATSGFAVAAYLPDGTPDTTFGTGGVSVANFSGGANGTGGIAIQPGDGKIVAVGSTGSNNSIAVARFLPPDTKIGSFRARPNPVTSGGSVTLTSSNILDSNPTRTITQVAFYLDSNADGILDSGDALLGYAMQTSPGVWTFTFSINLAPGTYTLFAQAQDSAGLFSDPLALSLQVQ
jgi:uncharacterized delta-60 repeat protein